MDALLVLWKDGGEEHVRAGEYKEEAELQNLLCRNPNILPGAEISPDNPLRWFVLGREVGIRDINTGEIRWSIDILLVDQFGVLTLVECKLSNDSRLRREVIGQLLEYAANAQAYFSAVKIEEQAKKFYGGEGNLAQAMRLFLRLDDEDSVQKGAESFWRRTEEKLRNGEIRLIIAADKIPEELQRTIAYLDQQMRDTEVLGVEIRLYESEKMQIIVPRLVGRNLLSMRNKGSLLEEKELDEQSFLEQMPQYAREFFRDFIGEAKDYGLAVEPTEKGLRVRVYGSWGSPKTVLFLYPPNASRNEFPEIQVYLGDIAKEGIDTEKIKQHLKSFDLKEAGNYTLKFLIHETEIQTGMVLKFKQQLWESFQALGFLSPILDGSPPEVSGTEELRKRAPGE